MLYKPVTKTHLLDAMRRWRSQWEDTLFAIGEDNMLCPSDEPCAWSARDIVAHASAYERWLMEWLEAGARGERARPSALDDPDQRRGDHAALQLTRSFPLDLVLGDSWLTWERLMMALERLSDEEISDPRRAPEFVRHRWGPGMSLGLAVANLTYEHYREHLPVLRQWICAPAHAS